MRVAAQDPRRPFNSICVIGLGYIGLPTAATLASRGLRVEGVDVSASVVDTINRGEIHIVEPLLDLTVQSAVRSGHLRAHLRPVEADAFIIAVPTPITDAKTADLSHVFAAGRSIAGVLKKGDLVILESTSPVGATEKLIDILIQARPDLIFPSRGMESEPDVHIAYCPERVLPGKVIEELVSNDRAIGGMTPGCTERAAALYRLFVAGELVGTDTRSAELCKLAENSFRDVNIAFANELANFCEAMDMNVWEVIRLANRHPRVNILNPGVGVGGHCIAVDPWFIVEAAPEKAPLIATARRINDNRPKQAVERVRQAAECFTKAKRRKPLVAALGLAFKPDIDDLRESPAVEVALELHQADWCELVVVEPNINTSHGCRQISHLELLPLDKALEKADLAVLLVNHRQFSALTDLRGDRDALISICREI